MRVDANVSVRRSADDPFGTRCEIKNLNSLRSLGRAIEYEARRQVDLLEGGESVRQETRHWDEDDGRTHTMRVKEEADDYRYFPEPDLVPLDPDQAWIERVRAELPVLPAERRAALAARRRRRARPQRRGPRGRAGPGRSGARRDRGGCRRGPGAGPRRAEPRRRRGRGARRRSGWPRWWRWRPAGSSPPRRPRPCWSRCSRPTPRQRTSPRPRASRRWTPARLSSSSTGSSTATPTSGALLVEARSAGEAKAEKKLKSFFVGKAMQQSKGKADGRLVTERLETRLGA